MKKSLLKNRKPKEEYLALLRQEDINAWFSKNFSWDDVHEKSFCCGQEFFTKSSCNEYLEMCGMEFDMDFEDSFHRSFVFFFGKSSTIKRLQYSRRKNPLPNIQKRS